jgi:hypothetical protein
MPSYSNRHLTSSDSTLRDFQHAARAFVDGDFALAPRLKFQYHVVFSTLGGSNAQLSLLAKTADTPKFAVTTETANQYNKKNVVMTGITYTPITFKLYDDNSGVARQLWEKYYAYTFGDHGAAKAGLYGKSLGPNFTGYGLENQPIVPFLNYIKIHTFAKRTWSGYTLINPVITAWSSDTFNWGDSAPAEHTMTIAYDAVTYDRGNAGAGSPPNFGQAGYDQTPSPLKVGNIRTTPANGVSGGQLTSPQQVFQSVDKKTDPSSAFSSVPTNTNATNNYNNLQTLTPQGVAKSASNAAIGNANNIGRTGFNNTAFPVYDKDTTVVTATRRNIVP